MFKNSLTIQSSINLIIHESPIDYKAVLLFRVYRSKSKISLRVHLGRIPTVFHQREISMSKCTSRANMRCTYLGHRAFYPPTICGTLGREDRAASILVTLIGCHSSVRTMRNTIRRTSRFAIVIPTV